MFKFVKSKSIAFFLIVSIILFYAPTLLTAKERGKGAFIGFIYGPDNTTPVEGAIVKMRSVHTGTEYESLNSDNMGMVEFSEMEEGLYIVGINTGQGDFNVDNVIGVKAKKTAKVTFALQPQGQEASTGQITERCPKGEWYVPEIEGQCDENYKWNEETERCECKKKSPLAFFLTPIGAGLIVAASAGAVVFSITGGEPSGSAFK